MQYGVQSLFSVVGAAPGKRTPEAVRATIARAFPGLAEAAQIEVLVDANQAVRGALSTRWFPRFGSRLSPLFELQA